MMVIPTVALGAATMVRARGWTHVTFWTDLVSRLSVYTRNVETFPYLDIAVNCMSTLVYDEWYTEAVGLFESTLGGKYGSRPSPGDSRAIRESMDRFIETFRDLKMQAGAFAPGYSGP